MSQRRHALSDKQWEAIRQHLPTLRTGPKSTLGDRNFLDAVFYRAYTGVPWRDLPERFGPWKSIYNRYANWSRSGHWERIFEAVRDFDDHFSIMDSTIVRAHQSAAGGKGGSRKTHWVVQGEGCLPKLD